MAETVIRTQSGTETTVSADTLDRFAAEMRGYVVPRGAPQYDDVRRVWNATVMRRPAVIVRCMAAADVVHAVRFAREHDLLIGVRGGGHNIAGNGLVDRGLLIDLSLMRSSRVDVAGRSARAEPGMTIGDFDRDTQTFALATPMGINSTTGIAGLTLGGGYGWLSRSYGLTVDNLLSADVVTAEGALVTASTKENSDLFWAIRGGGGNFGIVTSFEYRLHAVGPEVYAGLIVHPFVEAAGLLRRYREVVLQASDALSVWAVMRKAPPLPFLPSEVHGHEVVVFAVCYAGDPAEGEAALRPLRAIGTPHADVVGRMPYVDFQSTFDPLLAAGARNYWKSHNFLTLSDALIDTLVAQASHLRGPMCEIFLAHMGGAISQKAEDATAYAGRGAQFVMNVHGRWEDADDDDAFVAWARGVHASTSRYAARSAYVNFLTGDEQSRVRDAYGSNFDRLAAIKGKFDPTNVFRVNQNIAPAIGATIDGSVSTLSVSTSAQPRVQGL